MPPFPGPRASRLVLRCYLAWYLAIVAQYPRADLRILGLALCMALLVGLALILNAAGAGTMPRGWVMARFFLIPFCVSSYSAMTADRGFLLIFPPSPGSTAIALAACLVPLALDRLHASR